MKVKLENVGVIKHCDIEFIPGMTLIIGSSGSGKSTLMRSIYNLAANEFSDSDISFGKNTMTINIEHNGNNVTYSRSIKSKGDKCYYEVNGEKFVKLGRVVLPAVADALKIGDIEINGEKINFNFNLQFSSPFLILGSQSTLYNVLTYRSSFDISSINDYYNADIKNNNNEIATNIKLKDKFNDNLIKLEQQADELSPIEEIYSQYTKCKHKQQLINVLSKLCDSLKLSADLEGRISEDNNTIVQLSCTLTKIELVTNLQLYANKLTEYSRLAKYVKLCEHLLSKYNNAVNVIQTLGNYNKLYEKLQQIQIINNQYNIIHECINRLNKHVSIENFISDITRQYKLFLANQKCENIVCILSLNKGNKIDVINNLMIVLNKIESNNKTQSAIDDISVKCQKISAQLDGFDVCPLCGNHLGTHNVT